MRPARCGKLVIPILIGLFAFPLAAPSNGRELIMLDEPVFAVTLTDAAGNPGELFEPNREMFFNVRFALALSEVRPYPVRVHIEIGEGSRKEVIEAIQGERLDEGVWLLKQPVTARSTWGREVPFKVILRVRMADRQDVGTHLFYRWQTIEGSFRVGFR
jgi:hypothetical protein